MTLRNILEETINNESFKIYQETIKSKEDYLEINLSKEQALAYLSDSILDTPAKFTSGWYSINHVQLLESN